MSSPWHGGAQRREIRSRMALDRPVDHGGASDPCSRVACRFLLPSGRDLLFASPIWWRSEDQVGIIAEFGRASMDALRTGFWLIIVLSTLTCPAFSKTSRQLIKEDPRGQYAAIKRVIRPLLQSRHEDLKPRLLEHDNTYDFSCSGPRNFYDQFYGSDNKPELELQVFLDLAQEVVLLRLD